MDSKLQEFLKELTELSKKYDLYIGGDGSCDSPYITKGIVCVLANLEFSDELEQYTGYEY